MNAVQKTRTALRWAARLPLRFYKYCISPMLPPACRFVPTCSEYAAEAIEVHGIVRGGLLTLYRLLRCGPWSAGGYDPVPKPDAATARRASESHLP